jgi:DNA-directed RNA polymerase specialized sigma24 family protein
VTEPQQAPRLEAGPDWQAIRERILRRLGGMLRCPRDRLDDVVQEALLCMVVLSLNGQRTANHVAFGVTFARRRWMDDLRKRRRRNEVSHPDLDDQTAESPVDSLARDLPSLLRSAGWEPTEAQSRVLRAIGSGARGTSRIAKQLGRDVKSIRECRRRLRLWLQEKLRLSPPL